MNVKLRALTLTDLNDYRYWMHPERLHHSLNGPYFKKRTLSQLDMDVKRIRKALKNGEKDILTGRKMIVDVETDQIIGQVNWYWKSIETQWLEVGLVVFNERIWGQGIGYAALKLWIDEIFESFPSLVRIGLTTWSGNTGMMKLAQKMGFSKEASFKNARIVDGIYYDSVSFGIQKQTWRSLFSGDRLYIDLYPRHFLTDIEYKYVVLPFKFEDKWVVVRHRERHTWEIPGGHIESGETLAETAERELREETAAVSFSSRHLCDYAVTRQGKTNYGAIFTGEIFEFSRVGDYEIEEIKLVKVLPKQLTYPEIQPDLMKKIKAVIKEKYGLDSHKGK